MKLVDDVKRCWRWLSVQCMVVAGAIQTAWVFIPEDMKATFPKNWLQVITVALLVIGVVGRLFQQPSKIRKPKP